jgi:non-canonical purine NTP pyrophosphatase (RdgB/HAM1 family)
MEIASYDDYRDPVEGETSYADNAAAKARALREQLRAAGIDAPVLADDSGLEVAALGGRPGVTTAYYGGTGLTWAQRRAALLGELRRAGAVDRRCRFVCALHFIGSDDREFGTFATVEGEVAAEDRGEAGFSFDPIFVYPPAGKTFAEMTDAEKNRVSHRARAVESLIADIRRTYETKPTT